MDKNDEENERAHDTGDLIFKFDEQLKKIHRAYLRIFHDKYSNEFIKEVACSIQTLLEAKKELTNREAKSGRRFINERDDLLLINEYSLHKLYRIINRESELDRMLYF